MEHESLQPVRCFVRGLFRGVAETPRIAEQREEIETHIIDRVADGVARGLKHDKAFSEAVDSLGNLDELIETIIGLKKSIYVTKANFLMLAGGLFYGTLYMALVGLWLADRGFGVHSLWVALPGWLGFAIPALIGYLDYRKKPRATALVARNVSGSIRSSLIGWATISVSCWIVNIIVFSSPDGLETCWAWMPTFGVLTWPLMNVFHSWMVNHLRLVQTNPEE